MDNSTLINEILTKIADHRGKIQQFLDDPLTSDVVKTYYTGQDTGLIRAEDVVLSIADAIDQTENSVTYNSNLINDILTEIARRREKILQVISDPNMPETLKDRWSGNIDGLDNAADVVQTAAGGSVKRDGATQAHFESTTTELKACIDPMVYIEIFNTVVGDTIPQHGQSRRNEMIEAAKTTRKIIDEMFNREEGK
jgi:hypothetical protein